MKRKYKSNATRARPTVNGVVLNAAQEQLWRLANAELTSADFERRKRASGALRMLETELAGGQAAAGIRSGIDESIALARARGEQIVVSSGAEPRGRVSVRLRDGLETLERKGAINPLQYRAGLIYRGLYEITDPESGLRSQLASPALAGVGAPSSSIHREAWAERRVRLCRSIALLEDKVRVADRNGRAVRALREVAGHANCISHFVAGGGSQAVYRRALVLALNVCAAHFGLL